MQIFRPAEDIIYMVGAIDWFNLFVLKVGLLQINQGNLHQSQDDDLM